MGKTPLKGEKGGDAGGIDVEKFLETSLRIRLPLMQKDLSLGQPPQRQKKAKGSTKKKGDVEQGLFSGCQDKATALTVSIKTQAQDAAGDCFPGWTGSKVGNVGPAFFSKEHLKVVAKKYWKDIVTNAVYAGGGIVLAFVAGSTSTAQDAAAQAQSAAEVAAAQAQKE